MFANPTTKTHVLVANMSRMKLDRIYHDENEVRVSSCTHTRLKFQGNASRITPLKIPSVIETFEASKFQVT